MMNLYKKCRMQPNLKIPSWKLRMVGGRLPWDTCVELPVNVSNAIGMKTFERTTTLSTSNREFEVHVSSGSEQFWFSSGWPEFVDGNEIQSEDELQFNHTEKLRFHVLLQPVRVKQEFECEYAVRVKQEFGSQYAAMDNNKLTFCKLMVPALGTKGGQLNIPIDFMQRNNLGIFDGVVLKDPVGRDWHMKLNADTPGCLRVRMGKGWYDFYVGNGLQTGDQLSLKLLESAGGTMSFAVAISRC